MFKIPNIYGDTLRSYCRPPNLIETILAASSNLFRFIKFQNVAFGDVLRKMSITNVKRDKNIYSPTQSVHSLSEMDDYHNLSSSTCPALPQDNSNLEQIAANRLAQYLVVNSYAFILTPGKPTTVNVITPMIYDYGCKSNAESPDSDCVSISV